MHKTSIPAVKPTITYTALVGQVIERRRKQIDGLQEPIANALGITQSAYSRLEQGQSALTVTHVRTIAAYLGTSSAAIFTETDKIAAQLQRQGVQIIDDKQDSSKAGLLIALGLLAAMLAAGK